MIGNDSTNALDYTEPLATTQGKVGNGKEKGNHPQLKVERERKCALHLKC